MKNESGEENDYERPEEKCPEKIFEGNQTSLSELLLCIYMQPKGTSIQAI